jgi:hypothetical protein
MALTSPTSGGRSVGIVRWRTEAPEFVFVYGCRVSGDYIVTCNVFKSVIFWDMTLCSLIKVYGCCGGIFCLHLKGKKVSRKSKHQKEQIFCVSSFPYYSTVHRNTGKLVAHQTNVTSEKAALLTFPIVRTSNPAHKRVICRGHPCQRVT